MTGGDQLSATTSSGSWVSTRANKALVSPAWPTTWNPERSSRLASPARNNRSSSARIIRSPFVVMDRIMVSPAVVSAPQRRRVEALGGAIQVHRPAGQGPRLQIDLPTQDRASS